MIGIFSQNKNNHQPNIVPVSGDILLAHVAMFVYWDLSAGLWPKIIFRVHFCDFDMPIHVLQFHTKKLGTIISLSLRNTLQSP